MRSEEDMEDGTWKSGVIGTVRGQNLANHHTALAAQDKIVTDKYDADGATVIELMTDKGQNQMIWNVSKQEIIDLENE